MRLIKLACAICLILTKVATFSFEQLSRTPEVRRLQEYVQIDTETGKSLNPAVSFWSKLARVSKGKFSVYEYVESYPVVVIKWPGKKPSLSSIVLSTHMDVVNADVRDGWTYPPFSADIDEDGNMYGRGVQSIKSITMQHYEAVCRIKDKNIDRDIYMLLTPDKELGSTNGIVAFLKSNEFKDMNAGFFLTNGLPTQTNDIAVIYRGKTQWSFRIDCFGPSGPTNVFADASSSADGSCGRFYASYTKYRNEQYALLQSSCRNISDVTVINFVGPQVNRITGVTPNTISLYFDAYLAVGSSFCDFEAMVKEWIKESGEKSKLVSILLHKAGPEVKTGSDNPYWTAIQEASKSLNITFNAETNLESGEFSYITAAGYPVYGVSPQPNTENLIHAVDERINVTTYLKGITVFEEILTKITNIPADQVSNDPSNYIANVNTCKENDCL